MADQKRRVLIVFAVTAVSLLVFQRLAAAMAEEKARIDSTHSASSIGVERVPAWRAAESQISPTQEPDVWPTPTMIPYPASSDEPDRTLAEAGPLDPTPEWSPRGFQGLVASFYDEIDWSGFVTTRRWNQPIDFKKTCSNQAPYTGCKLIDELADGQQYGVEWVGQMFVSDPGDYVITLQNADDWAQIDIDGGAVVTMPQWVPGTYTGSVSLEYGWHPVHIWYLQNAPSVAQLHVRWSGPGVPDEVIPVLSLPNDQAYTPNECPICGNGERQSFVGGPINAFSGNYSYRTTDLSIPTRGQPLRFVRTYNSLSAMESFTNTSRLGYGWTHNYDLRLTFPGDPGGEANMVILQAPHGSRMRFRIDGDTFEPYAGVWATMTRTTTSPYTYTVTAVNQETFVFNADGQLVLLLDPLSHRTILSYTNGLLSRVSDDTGERWLTLEYETDGRLGVVTDHTNRQVEFGYESGDLRFVPGRMGGFWTYVYSGTTHLLHEVVDPSDRVVERTFYDEQGRAFRQENGLGELVVELDYRPGGGRVITETGRVMSDTYNAQNVLESQLSLADQQGVSYTTDGFFNRTSGRDANGNSTLFSRTQFGLVTAITDALTSTTRIWYDSYNSLTRTVQAAGTAEAITTSYAYQDPVFPTFVTAMTDTLGNSWIYTPTAEGLLWQERDPLGNRTVYGYDPYGQVTLTVRAAGTADAVTTTHGYDDLGRLITTTQLSAGERHTTLNVYNSADRLVATIANWTGSDPAGWQSDCVTSGGERDSNVCTRYGYDQAGRQTSVTNPLGQIDLTVYDGAGRPFLRVTNWDGVTSFESAEDCDFVAPDPEWNLCSLTEYDPFSGRVAVTTDPAGDRTRTFYNPFGGQVQATVAHWSGAVQTAAQCQFPPAEPDQDLCTLYQYDPVGNTIVVTDALGSMTRSFYDELNRVEATVSHWQGTITDPDQCQFPPAQADRDLCTRYQYDLLGNTIVVTDPLGSMTRSFYDSLGRLQASVANWDPASLNSPADCLLSPTNRSDENLCTLHGYDAAGRPFGSTNAAGQTTLTVYDRAGRPAVSVANWDGTTAIDGPEDCDYADPAATGNLCTVTRYDSLGRRSRVTDAMGYHTDFGYDGLGRVVTTTRYLADVRVESSVGYDALGNRLWQADPEGHTVHYSYDGLNRLVTTLSQEGVAITRTYDAAGRLVAVTNGLDQTTTSSYDHAGRLATTTDPEGNATHTGYDALGRRTVITDANEIVTHYGYDGLGRLASVTENYTATAGLDPASFNVTTRYHTDAAGQLISVTDALTHTTVYTYDGLGRQVAAADPLGHATRTAYNPLGARLVLTDANGTVTHHAYDPLNRLSFTQYPTATVQFAYDRLGNRTAMTDSVGTTVTEYDELSRPATVTDPFSGTVIYGYDRAGNRTQLVYPDSKVVSYSYDGDNRLVEVVDWDQGVTAYSYDPAGRPLETSLPNGITTTYGYDAAGRLVQIEHRNPAGELVARYQYQLDGVGNRIRATELVLRPEEDETTNPAEEKSPVSMALQSDAGRPRIRLALERDRLTADGRDSTRLLALVTDEWGRPVLDGTRVELRAEGGLVSPAELTTAGGLIFARLQAGGEAGVGRVTIHSGNHQAEALFELLAPAAGQVRLDSGTADGALPFDLAAVVERARNTIQVPERGLPYVEQTGHRALFDGGSLHFVPQPAAAEPALWVPPAPLTLTVALAEVAVGDVSLFQGPAPAELQLDGNVARADRGRGLVEAWVARDGGVEQRWWLQALPAGLGGELTIAVEVETPLLLAPAPGGEGFVFRAVDPRTGLMTEVAGYGRALAVDAAGRAKRALLRAEERRPVDPTLHRYRLEMVFPAGWLAEATFPLLIDPLVGNLLRLDAATTQAGSQEKPAVAYNPAAGQYLVVWQDGVGKSDDIHGQIVDADGLLVGENFVVAGTTSDETAVDVAYNSDDDTFLVVWRNGTSYIKGSIVQADGSVGSEIAVYGGQLTVVGNPAVAYSSQAGKWLVAMEWYNGFTSNWDIYAQVVNGNGTLGSSFPVYTDSNDDTFPDVAANDHGQFLVVWERSENWIGGGIFQTKAQRATDTGVQGNAFVVWPDSVSQFTPGVTFNPDGDEYLVVWQKAGDGQDSYDTIWGRRVLGARTNEQEFPAGHDGFLISPVASGDRNAPDVTYFAPDSGGQGIYLAAWELQNGTYTDLEARWFSTSGVPSGSAFTLSGADGSQSGVVLAFGPAQGATLAAWTDGRAGNPDVRARPVGRDGQLGYDTLLHPAPGDQTLPQAAYNPDDDEYLVVWQDYRSGAANPDIYGQRVTGGGELVGENIAVTTAPYRQLAPQVAYGPGSGTYLVVWRHYPGSSDYYYDVYGQRVSSSGALVGAPLAIANRSGYADRESPTDIVYNSTSNKFLVLWHDLRSGYWNIWGRHVSPAGAMDTAIQITFLNSQHENTAVGAYDPADDQYLIVWQFRSTPAALDDLRGRRMTGGGSVYQGETLLIAVGSGDEQSADVVFHPASGRYLVVWEDSASGNWDVRGRPVLPDGTLDGSSYPIAAGSQDERYPRIAADPTGGGMVVWQGYEGGDGAFDLHGRQLWTDGQPVGASFVLVENDEDQQGPCVVGDGKGGYLLAWQDSRNGNWDVYGVPLRGDLRAIEYQYDGLQRLTEASYSTGERFQYAHDAVGNRTWMTHTTPLIGRVVTRYTYDAANQLTHVNGIALTWDNNGNLLQDQAGYMYTYDAANRLVKVVQLSNVYSYAYNGTGDRLQQTVNGVVVTYTLDLYGGLTQVLEDGSNGYLYGLGRIGEVQPAGWAYHLADGLGSVRQLADASGEVTMAQSYRPYGELMSSSGLGDSAYSYTGEWTDETGLVHLRARYYAPASGRFLTRDPWGGSVMRPGTFNGYSYVTNNPIRLVDPQGLCEVDPYDPYYDYDCWALAAQVAEMIGDTWENVGLHNSYHWLVDAYNELSSVSIYVSYDPFFSYLQGFRIGVEWLFEFGPQTRVFGPEESLTIDLMYDIGMQWARQDYAANGYPPSHFYPYRIDETGVRFGTSEAFIRENLKMAACIAGYYSYFPEGRIDMIGVALGSYDVYFNDLGDNMVLIQVFNESFWESFTRYVDPFTREEKALIPDRERDRNLLTFGGTTRQLFWWVESRDRW